MDTNTQAEFNSCLFVVSKFTHLDSNQTHLHFKFLRPVTNTLIFIWTIVIVLASSSVGALIWAIQTGQFKQLHRNADSIFDQDEPIGQITDSFPEPKK